MIEILRARNQALDLVGTEHDRQAEPLLRIRQVLAHVAPLQHIPAEEPQRADLRDHRPDGEPSLLEEKQVVASELGRGEPIEARASVLAKRLNDLDVAADGRARRSRDAPTRRAGIAVAWSQTPPVTTHPILLRITRLPVGRRASGFVLVAKGRGILTRSINRQIGVHRDLSSRVTSQGT